MRHIILPPEHLVRYWLGLKLTAGLLTRGSSALHLLPGQKTSGCDERLAAYSCEGSRGLSQKDLTAFPFHLRMQNRSALLIGDVPKLVQ